MCKTQTFPATYSVLSWLLAAAVLILLPAHTMASEGPKEQPDNSWINVSGSVKSVATNYFILDYGEGTIIVEMDDSDRDAKGYALKPGDKVSVTGMVDDDLFEKASIEASSVYIEKLGTHFFASKTGGKRLVLVEKNPVIDAELVVEGVVSEIDDDSFEIDTGFRAMTVNIATLDYNPLDDKGYLRIKPGDVVRVTGRLDRNLFLNHEILADHVTKILD